MSTGMRVLVTGATGFLGRVVTAVLVDHGHQVAAATRDPDALSPVPGVEVLHADIRDARSIGAALDGWQLDGVCHLAAASTVRESFANPAGYYLANVAGTANLLQALRRANHPVPVVFTSTNAVYGSSRVGALSEDLPPDPGSPYAASKLAAEQLLGYEAATGRIGAVVLRCFNIAGGYRGVTDHNETRIITNALRCAAGEIPHVTLNGDGSAVREFVHVYDVAEACRLALDAARLGGSLVLNVGTGEGASMRQVLDVARAVTGHPIPVVERPPVAEPHTLVADARRIGEVLGWKPQRSAVEAIVRDAWEAWA